MTLDLRALTTKETDAFMVLLAEAAAATLGVADRRRYERYRMRPKVEPLIERWSVVALGASAEEPVPDTEVEGGVGHMFPQGSMQQRFEAVMDASMPPAGEDELIAWLSGCDDQVPNGAGLVLECVRDHLRRESASSVRDVVSYTRGLYSCLDADDAFDALVRHALDRVRDGDLPAARASVRERSDAALRDKST